MERINIQRNEMLENMDNVEYVRFMEGKGYTRELYLQRKSRWDSKDKQGKNNQWMYLSPDKIKKISIKLGKW